MVRQWRDLTRLRKKYVQSVEDYRKQTHKLFETANIKIEEYEDIDIKALKS